MKKAQTMPVTEDQLQTQIIELAHYYGWVCAHFRGVRVQRKDGTVYYQTPVQADGKGYPDLVLVRERVIWIECKSDDGKLSLEQEQWRDAIKRAGGEWYLWRPSTPTEEMTRILQR